MKSWWDENWTALSLRNDLFPSRLWIELKSRGPAPDTGLRSRSGEPIPGWTVQGSVRGLESTYAPDKEARRWAEGLKGGTVVVFGMAGPDVVQCLVDQNIQKMFWVEPRWQLWQSALTWQNWTKILLQPSWVPVFGTSAHWENQLAGLYQPLWHGGLETREWRPATPPGEDFWKAYRTATRQGLEAIAADASTQAKFGERWYRNTLWNLRNLKTAHFEVPGADEIAVVGAGPSLDDALGNPQVQHWIESRSLHANLLIATDTGFPALIARGIVPDLVVSLDSQVATRHHFVGTAHYGVPWLADLAAVPSLPGSTAPSLRFLSNHPFSEVVRRFFPDLTPLDTRSGNVGSATLQLAWNLGAQKIHTWGIDFAYRWGQAYARGTYPGILALMNQSRWEPQETILTKTVYGAAGRVREVSLDGTPWDTTPLLRQYRSQRPGHATSTARLGQEARPHVWERFATDWRNRIRRLPLPALTEPLPERLNDLDTETAADWRALFPLALSLHRTGVPSDQIAEATRDRALAILDSVASPET